MTAPSTRVWLLTFVSLVFLIGVSAGVLVDRFALRPPPPGENRLVPGPPPSGPPAERVADDLEHELHLTPAQRESVVTILNDRLPHLHEMQQEARDRFNSEQQALHDAIAAVLTPDQLTRFGQMAPLAPGIGRGGPPPRGGGPGRPGGPPPPRGRRGGD